MVPLHGGEPKPLLQTPATERSGEISPNGKWLAYELIGERTNEYHRAAVPKC
jgi:hypothetical protein